MEEKENLSSPPPPKDSKLCSPSAEQRKPQTDWRKEKYRPLSDPKLTFEEAVADAVAEIDEEKREAAVVAKDRADANQPVIYTSPSKKKASTASRDSVRASGSKYIQTSSCISSEDAIETQRRRSPGRLRRSSSPHQERALTGSRSGSSSNTSSSTSTPSKSTRAGRKAHAYSTDVPPLPMPLHSTTTTAAPSSAHKYSIPPISSPVTNKNAQEEDDQDDAGESRQQQLPTPLVHPIDLATQRREEDRKNRLIEELKGRSFSWRMEKIKAVVAGQRTRAMLSSTFAQTLRGQILEANELIEKAKLHGDDAQHVIGISESSLRKQRTVWTQQLVDFMAKGSSPIHYSSKVHRQQDQDPDHHHHRKPFLHRKSESITPRGSRDLNRHRSPVTESHHTRSPSRKDVGDRSHEELAAGGVSPSDPPARPPIEIKRLKKGDGMKRYVPPTPATSADSKKRPQHTSGEPSVKPLATSSTPSSKARRATKSSSPAPSKRAISSKGTADAVAAARQETGLSPHQAAEAFDEDYTPPSPTDQLEEKQKKKMNGKPRRISPKRSALKKSSNHQGSSPEKSSPTKMMPSDDREVDIKAFSSADAARTTEFIANFLRERLDRDISSTYEERQVLCKRFFSAVGDDQLDAVRRSTTSTDGGGPSSNPLFERARKQGNLITVPRLTYDSPFFRWENARGNRRSAANRTTASHLAVTPGEACPPLVFDATQHHLTSQLIHQEMYALQAKVGNSLME